MCRRFASKHFVSIAWVEFDLLECLKVASKVGGIIPAHCVDKGLGDFPGESWVSFREIAVEVFEFHKALLLDDLRVDVGGAHSSNL